MACGRGLRPTGCGCGGCGRGDPSPTPQRALLPAGFARRGGGTRAPRGGASLARLWGVRGWALTCARPPVFWASGRGLLPTGRGWGGVWGGDVSRLGVGRPLPTGCGCGVWVRGPGCPSHLLPCRGSTCVVRASRHCLQRCVVVTQNKNNCELIEEKCQQITNNNLTFLCTRRTMSFNSTCDAHILFSW